jgi:calcineurin-like phosphoesterase family protein
MTKSLYDEFAKRWYRGGSIWFYSDPHFNDEDSKEFRTKRGVYISDEEQVKRINSKLGKKDTIIFLGDICDIEYAKKIRGYKVLVLGNHDAGATNYTEVFDEVYEGAVMIGPKLILSHEPFEFPYAFNIHGHDHSGHNFHDDMHLNVCAELINYTPIPIKDIITSGKLKNVTDIHREAIDKQAKEASKRKK